MAITERTALKGPRLRKCVAIRVSHGEIEYPESDGKPMAETLEHLNIMIYAIEALRDITADRPDAFVGGNQFLYYQEGDPRKCVAPDCYVMLGVERKSDWERATWKVWRENGQVPAFVLETTSKTTRLEDERVKRPLYRRLGIREYFRFDPTGDYLEPRLQGSRLVNGRYVPIEPVDGKITCEVLNADFYAEGRGLRIVDRRTGKVMLTAAEKTARAIEAQALAESEANRANTAEAEIARLRAELKALRRERGSDDA